MRAVVETYGLPLRYYVDSLRVFRFVRGRDSFWRNHVLRTDDVDTQWGKMMTLLGVDVTFALSAQAKGNSLFRTFSVPSPYTSAEDVFCLRETRTANAFGRMSLSNRQIRVANVPLRREVEVHLVPNQSKSCMSAFGPKQPWLTPLICHWGASVFTFEAKIGSLFNCSKQLHSPVSSRLDGFTPQAYHCLLI